MLMSYANQLSSLSEAGAEEENKQNETQETISHSLLLSPSLPRSLSHTLDCDRPLPGGRSGGRCSAKLIHRDKQHQSWAADCDAPQWSGGRVAKGPGDQRRRLPCWFIFWVLSGTQLVEFHDHHLPSRLLNKMDLNCVSYRLHAQYFLNKYIFL